MLTETSTEFSTKKLIAHVVQDLEIPESLQASTAGGDPEPQFFRVISYSGSTIYFMVSMVSFSSKNTGVGTPEDEIATTATSMDFDAFAARIQKLAELRPGWLDGEGEAFPSDAKSWLLVNFATLPFFVRPSLSPTPEGDLCAEWSIGDWEASAQINLRDRSVWWHALNVQDASQEQDEEFQLETLKDWKRLCSLANALLIS